MSITLVSGNTVSATVLIIPSFFEKGLLSHNVLIFCRKGSGLWCMGSRMAGLVVLYARDNTAIGALVG